MLSLLEKCFVWADFFLFIYRWTHSLAFLFIWILLLHPYTFHACCFFNLLLLELQAEAPICTSLDMRHVEVCAHKDPPLKGIMHSSLCDAAWRYGRGACQGFWWVFVTWLSPLLAAPLPPASLPVCSLTLCPSLTTSLPFLKCAVLLSEKPKCFFSGAHKPFF